MKPLPALPFCALMTAIHTDGVTMRPTPLLTLLLALAVLSPACDGNDPADDDDTTEEIPPPGEFRAGVAEVAVPAPVGIGTCGFGYLGTDPSPSPFADLYPATTRIHAALRFKAVALSRGEHYELVFLRTDAIGIFQQFREAVLDELEDRLGRDMDDALIFGANHTHSGPGRIVYSDSILTLLTDEFFPEFYERMVDAAADAVELALADLAPAEVGHVMAETYDAHNDRRCANDALTGLLQDNPSLPVIAVRRDGRLDALVMSYGYHGTVLDIGDLTLSPDMGGIVELKVAERFDHPVTTLLFNSWGGDMAPGDGDVPGDPGADQPDGFDRMEGLGVVIADTVEPLLDGIVYTTEPVIRGRTYRVAHDLDAIGYGPDEFDYEWGGAYCQGEENCVDDTPVEGIDQACVEIPEEAELPRQSVFTMGQVDDLVLTTATGEWTTGLADILMTDISAIAGGADVMFIGYAQDYTGYSLPEDDWWQGGYETSGTLWGPRQGDYFAARAAEMFANFHDGTPLPFTEPAPVPAFSGYTVEPYQVEAAVDAGTLLADVPSTVAPTDVLSFTVRGSDPWLGTPVATLERDAGSGFAPVLRANGTEVTSEGYELWIDLTTDPTYADQMPASQREFRWTFSFPVSHRVSGAVDDLSGQLRFVVSVPTENGDVEVTTSAFTVSGRRGDDPDAPSPRTPSHILHHASRGR